MDYEYWCRISKNYEFLCLENTTLACFRHHPKSKTISQETKFWQEIRQASLENGGKFFSEMFFRHYLEVLEKFSKKHFPKWLTNWLKAVFRSLKRL